MNPSPPTSSSRSSSPRPHSGAPRRKDLIAGLERIVEEARRPVRTQPDPRVLDGRAVARVIAPTVARLATRVREADVTAAVLEEIDTFVKDDARSPAFGWDVEEARAEAHRLLALASS